MDSSTYEQLKKNPHYKMSEKQRIKAIQYGRTEMVEFGAPKFHNQDCQTHQVQKKPRKKLEE